MLNLTNHEKAILVFLTLAFASGLSVSVYKKSQKDLTLSVRPSKINPLRAEADKFIKQQRFININSLKIEELTRLPGVGEKIAARIVQYRKSHGPFSSKGELMRVKGIGEKKFEQMKDLIVLEQTVEK